MLWGQCYCGMLPTQPFHTRYPHDSIMGDRPPVSQIKTQERGSFEAPQNLKKGAQRKRTSTLMPPTSFQESGAKLARPTGLLLLSSRRYQKKNSGEMKRMLAYFSSGAFTTSSPEIGRGGVGCRRKSGSGRERIRDVGSKADHDLSFAPNKTDSYETISV